MFLVTFFCLFGNDGRVVTLPQLLLVVIDEQECTHTVLCVVSKASPFLCSFLPKVFLFQLLVVCDELAAFRAR